MSVQGAALQAGVRLDGFGRRQLVQHPHAGRVEVLEVSPALSTPMAEQAIRSSAARLTSAALTMVADVVEINRDDAGLRIVSAVPNAIPLSDMLAGLGRGSLRLPDHARLELAADAIRAVAALHQSPSVPAHGALSPCHVLVCKGPPEGGPHVKAGGVQLTGAVFGSALEGLQCNREQLWRVFGVALPPSATLPRFDQRADVTQLGAIVLAILLGRPLRLIEYPKTVADLVGPAVDGVTDRACRSALRAWLQQALQLQAKALFGSAADAAEAFAEIAGNLRRRRAGALALHSAVRQLCGASGEEPSEMEAPAAAEPARREPVLPPPSRGFALIRNVIPLLRAN